MFAQKIPLASGLWLVGVPIGTARDITLRALDVLLSADILAAEDTRSLRKLLDIHGIPLGDRRITSLHDHTSTQTIDRLVSAMGNGQSVAYTSEAGMPLIADPGFELVKAARAAQLTVTSAPGPSSVTTALALGGLGTDSFHFAGFLPNTKASRRKTLESLRDVQATLVFFESPKRISATLSDAADVLGGMREARLCRELTKRFEEVIPGTLSTLAEHAARTPPRGEIVLLVDRAKEAPASEETIVAALHSALESMSLKDAAKFVADAKGAPRRDVYQIALSLKT